MNQLMGFGFENKHNKQSNRENKNVKYNIIQLLHFIECDMMCYGALKSNIDQGRRPRSILLFSAP
jgi:hypothetical protein